MSLLALILILCFMASSAIKIKQQSSTFSFGCPSGTVLKGRRDWTDQQPEGTAFAGFTCCPETHPDLYYLNENYICCPAGTGARCNANVCNCNSAKLKGGQIPTITKKS